MNTRTRKLTTLAILAALAYVVMVVGRIPLITVPLTLKYDPKDVVIAIGGFIFGPLSAAAMSIVVSLVEMVTVSENGIIGAVMNILSTCAFVCPAAYIYKRRHKLSGAIVGLFIGVILMTAVMLLWNYFLTPIYTGYPRSAVVKLLIPTFLPFNLLKAGLNAGITMLIYKPLRLALSRTRLLPETGGGDNKKALGMNLGTILISLFIISSVVLLIFVFQGKI